MGSLQSSRISLVLAGISIFAVAAPAGQDTWTRKADMPTARSLLSTCEVNGRIFAIGGGLDPFITLSTVEEYDPTTDKWTTRASLPEVIVGLSTSAVDGKIYALGGAPSAFGIVSPRVYVYDPATNTWARKADMPTARAYLSASAVNGKIYAIGGATTGVSQPLATVEEYDPATDTWARKADMPTARCAHSAGVVDGTIYVVGGMVGGPTTAWMGLSVVEAYDPATNTWTRKADVPAPTFFHSVSAAAGKIYSLGGGRVLHGDVSTVCEYDPITNIWIGKTPMPTARMGLSTSSVDGKIYAIGGGTVSVPTVEGYDTGLGVPVPDFNTDGMVDINDLLILIEHWGQNDPRYDVAPLPFGDGVVDVKDLEVLMGYWGQEILDPTLIAHWRLDEAEGIVAADSAGANDGALAGDPTWQPTGGKVGGALELDGIDDCVTIPFLLNPADGPFSVFAWVNGGAPGQVAIAQQGGVNWLMVDPATGALTTELQKGGRNSKALYSDAAIADGAWHRVGFTWDGSNRTLYVDGIVVAKDTQTGLANAFGGLYLGAGSTLAPSTFWSGLVDDVRIYNRVVQP
jgi:N-acetylneuraminic acid mutarotase